MANSKFKLFFNGVNKVFMALGTCVVALGGATVGIIAGTIKGPVTEIGLVRGACVGAVTGAITALQLMDGEPFSKESFICSLVNGQIFADWVTPAVLKAYQFQVSGVETTFADVFDVYEINGSKGVSEDSINKLPRFMFKKKIDANGNHDSSNCAICLQNFKNREQGRELPKCRHVFHLMCIDEWLIRSGSCPICRRNV